MTPQCNVSLHYSNNKQPLLKQQTPVTLFNNKSRKSKKKNRIKCVLVGDKAVGKTSLVVSYSNDSFPYEYVPTAYDNYNVDVQVDGKPIRIELCDTSGEDGLNPLRSLCYPGADVFMLCFSIVHPASFHSAAIRWADELSKYKKAAIVLVGTQSDLQFNHDMLRRLMMNGQRPVTQSEARELADRLGAPYVETSAKTCNHLKEAFDLAITMALRKQNRRRKLWRKLCCI